MTVDPPIVRGKIEQAQKSVGRVWPLYSDVAANPLAGFEDRPFGKAVRQAERLYGGRGYPTADQFRQAWDNGWIDPSILEGALRDADFDDDPAATLERIEAREAERADDGPTDSPYAVLDRLLSKWLAAYLDQGQAAWSMPNREAGFYGSWRELAPYDDRIPNNEALADLPHGPMEALALVLVDYPLDEWEELFRFHLAALPGWTGFIKRRSQQTINPWQSDHEIDLAEYLAVRLILAKHLDLDLLPEAAADVDVVDDAMSLPEVWLTAWEETYRQRLLAAVERGVAAGDAGDVSAGTGAGDGEERPDAQLVFCIDTRSEVIRRHVERAGDYETFGYAGFFGIPMAFSAYESDVRTKSCPALVEPKHRIVERPESDKRDQAALHDRWTSLSAAAHDVAKSLKKDIAAAFGFVETAGGLFGAAMAARTLLPHRLGSDFGTPTPEPTEFCVPEVDRMDDEDAADEELPLGLTVSEKVAYAAAAFEQMGWTDEFARVVAFVGHRTDTVNNPFQSSLDCGACAGSSGEPNARALATICNEPTVRERLRERGIAVPEDTVFVAGGHNTTTDEVTLFAGDSVPESHAEDVADLRQDLAEAAEGAAAERIRDMDGEAPGDTRREVKRRANDWAETRPENGLSGNAGFVIGPREITADADLDGRAFLHSYDWSTDRSGEALESIMTGPLVVGHMISAQYYFSTVDNAVYGSGSKITHNAVGKFGVFQGNGGDLMTGLPLQSLEADDGRLYHRPLRLTAVVHAPADVVADIVRRNEVLSHLLDNGWMHLTVVDPTADDAVVRYEGDLEWDGESSPPATADPPVATD